MLAHPPSAFPAPSTSNPASPTFPLGTSHSINGAGLAFALRPGTSLGRAGEPPLRSPSTGEDPTYSARRGRSYLEYIKSWNDEQVARWLVEAKVGQHEEVFRANDIRGNVLLDVDQQALKEMGIKSVGDRVKIVVAVKALRQRCVTAAWTERRAHAGSVDHSASMSPAGSGLSRDSPPVPPPTDTATVRRSGSGRAPGRIPPPLHLSQSNSISTSNLPQAWQPPSSTASSGPRPTQTPLGPPPIVTSPRSSTSSRSIPPPNLPPPRSQPPPPPISQHRNRDSLGPLHLSTAAHGRAPSISTTAASPTNAGFNSSSSSWGGDYGLPRGPAPGNLAGGVFGRSPAPPPPSQRPPAGTVPARPSSGGSVAPPHQAQHRKTESAASNTLSRPPGSGYSAYAYPTVSSPVVDAFGGQSLMRPTHAGKGLLPSPTIGGPLSPVSETVTTPTSDGNRTPSSYSSPGRDTGYGSGRSMAGPSSSSLDAVMRKALKFIGEDGVSKMVAVSDCSDGREVLVRVLRKFQKISGSAGGDPELTEGWGVFTVSDESQSPTRPLSEMELFAICRDGQAPERQRGLVLRRIPSSSSDPNSQVRKRGRKLQWMFGEDHAPETTLPGGVARGSPMSPNYLGVEIPSTMIEPASSSENSSPDSDRADFAKAKIVDLSQPTLNDRGSTKRASTISVMSGLGADWGSPGRPSDLAQPSTTNSPSSGSFLSSGRKLRNFFGQRPPSELIATHLTEYFPKAEPKLLSKQVRQSMRKSVVRRDSQYSVIATSWEKAPDRYSLSPAALSRFSGSSGGSIMPAHAQAAAPDREYPSTPPRISSIPRTSGESLRSSAPPSILETPDESAEDEDDEEGYGSAASTSFDSAPIDNRRSSRISVASRLSGAWDRRSHHSDAASVLTVDEVTAELETRRASMVGYVSDEEEKTFDGLLRPPSIALSRGGDADEESEEEDDEDDYSEEEEEPVTSDVASIRGKPTTKWIKGALIGAGSFGSVYLGMNPMNGSLMAVKQVELPTGHSHNEERKKSMLDALEREIELLKELQHENIVQYLDSSSDATHLNIFLEYVPGGSVAALLSNYGAFEEALVSKFVRQILTGLEYLHEREIIHRDIKGANILVDNKGGIKISDFGISKKVEDNLLAGAHRPSLQGSVYWMAPEVVKQTSYTAKADIWSLGCLVVEMLTGTHPWANLTQMQAIFRIGSSVSPAIPEDISIEADEFLEQTFLIDHNERPSAIDLLAHAFIRDPDAPAPASQQTPTRATFSAGNSPATTGRDDS